MKLRYTPEAISDLQETKSYISKVLRNPKAAARITNSILKQCEQLKEHPNMGMSISAGKALFGADRVTATTPSLTTETEVTWDRRWA